MQESLVLFESVINSRWFLRTSVILFLNKIDVFKQKLPKVPLVHYFPEYTGGSKLLASLTTLLPRSLLFRPDLTSPILNPPRPILVALVVMEDCPLTLPRRRRYQQSCQIHPLAVYSDQPRPT